MIDKNIALQLVGGKPWHQDFEIIPGVRTNGAYNPEHLWNELQLPSDLTGVSVADIGASNGYFSFEARKCGATVVAFDSRHKDNSGFGLAQYINGISDIEHHHVNILDIMPEEYGQFDIVLVLGLLYHVPDPYRALANCAALSSKRLLVESYCIDTILPKPLRREPIMKFIADPWRFPTYWHINQDLSNFWGFTSVCLQRMIEDVGFTVQRMNLHGNRVFLEAERTVFKAEETRLRFAYGTQPVVPTGKNPDTSESWTFF